MGNLQYLPVGAEIGLAGNLATAEKLAELYKAICSMKSAALAAPPPPPPPPQPAAAVPHHASPLLVAKLFRLLLTLPMNGNPAQLCFDGRYISEAFRSLKPLPNEPPLPEAYFLTQFITDFLHVSSAMCESATESDLDTLTVLNTIYSTLSGSVAKDLSWASNKIRHDAIPRLVGVSFCPRFVESLDLSDNALGSRGILILGRCLAKRADVLLSQLGLAGNAVESNEESLEGIQTILSSLKYEAGSYHVHRLLYRLDLSRNLLGDQTLEQAKDHIVWTGRLRWLDLSFNRITPKSCKALRYIVDMKSDWETLDLRGNSVVPGCGAVVKLL